MDCARRQPFPVPLSPVIKTVELLFANLAISARTMCILALFPTKGLLSALLNWDASDLWGDLESASFLLFRWDDNYLNV